MFKKIEQRNINIAGQDYEYTLRRKSRAKYLRLSIEHDGGLVLTAPITYPVFLIKKFLVDRFDWIAKGLEKKKANPTILGIKHSEIEIKQYKKQARVLVGERLKYFNKHYNFKYNRVAIRNQKSRWGSCSSSKNLNFNYRLAMLPVELADYIIVHELCHLGEMNHSKHFWSLVSQTIPDHKNIQKKLKKI
ncbi:MAG: M48 family metallopeptidase [Candidatus Komeilibacteria bacterium]|jgi:predicted metal-dependent hydrolase|nr:M48 family metallopeptidase [Candidatus Komeilibacteria bacterium]MBT4447914.1 M48 family metallopeptidase [Candidatus Komeilibacteria bacterium]